MRSHSSYVVTSEQNQQPQNYRIKKTKASAVYEQRTEVKNPSEEKKTKTALRNFVVKKAGKTNDDIVSRQQALGEIPLKTNIQGNNSNVVKEPKTRSSHKAKYSMNQAIERSSEKFKNENVNFSSANKKMNKKGGKNIQAQLDSEYYNMKDSALQPMVKENQHHESNRLEKGQYDMMAANQTFGMNLRELPKDLTPEEAKKLLYLQNNEIKTAFNYFSEENKKLETKIKQIRKERERMEKEISNIKNMTGSKIQMNNFVQNTIFNENTNSLKQVLKERKDKVLQIQHELKELRKNLKDESVLALTNENMSLLAQIHELKEEIQNFNAEDIEQQFGDLKGIQSLNKKLIQQKNSLTVG